LLGSADQALKAAQRASALVAHMPGTVWPLICDFWHGLTLAVNIEQVSDAERARWIAQLKRIQNDYQAKSAHCAENFLCQAQLLEAEIARIEGRDRDAVALYTDAIEFSYSKPLLPYQALAHELLGRFRLQRGQLSLAAINLQMACNRYRRWGAAAKADAMVRQYPLLAEDPEASVSARSEPAAALRDGPSGGEPPRADPADGLDLMSLLKVTQAIAGDIELEQMLGTLLNIAIENAGAERGALVLEGEAGPIVYANGSPEDAESGKQKRVELERSPNVCAGIVNYVRRTGDSVVLAQAQTDEQFGDDPYVLGQRPQSVACLPVQRQGRLIGVLYLEHRRVASAFASQRLGTLQILAGQAAVSLERARQFEDMRQEIAERRQAQQQLTTALAQVGQLRDALVTENTYLRRDLMANVSHDLRTPLASMRGYLEMLASKGESLTTEQRKEYLGIVVRQSERLATLIDELFELARLDFRGMVLERESFSFAELAADVLQKYKLTAEGKGIQLGVEATPRPPSVLADLRLIERVLDNLIGNAIQRAPTGGHVTLRWRTEGNRLLTQVADTGHPIPATELPFVFDRFYHGGDGRTHTSSGGELGLAITKRILELHDTGIDVQSDEKTGTSFTFSLPLYGVPTTSG
jgi:signal transduction histidine kinase